jgi:hypothetical protein
VSKGSMPVNRTKTESTMVVIAPLRVDPKVTRFLKFKVSPCEKANRVELSLIQISYSTIAAFTMMLTNTVVFIPHGQRDSLQHDKLKKFSIEFRRHFSQNSKIQSYTNDSSIHHTMEGYPMDLQQAARGSTRHFPSA